MAKIDTLKIYKAALDSGFTEQQALFQAETAKLSEPEVDLKLAFEKIDNRFNLMDQKLEIEIKYLEKIGFAIIGAILIHLIFAYFK